MLGAVAPMLVLIDLFAWAMLWNVPYPISKVLVATPNGTTHALERRVFDGGK